MIEKPPGATLAECEHILAAADSAGVLHQVAFNRRHMPTVRCLREIVRKNGSVQNIRYSMCRCNRVESFFFVTAVHGIDYVRHIAGSDYSEANFRYQPLTNAGEGVCNIYMDCAFESGATAQMAFLVKSGCVHERMMITCEDTSIFANIPIWNGADAPGFISRSRCDGDELYINGSELSDSDELFVTNGFYGEIKSFLDDIEAGRQPADGLESAKQVIELGECIANRSPFWRT